MHLYALQLRIKPNVYSIQTLKNCFLTIGPNRPVALNVETRSAQIGPVAHKWLNEETLSCTKYSGSVNLLV